MNYKARALAVLVAATVSSAALASDGKIDFNGELKAETCKVAVNGASGANGTTVTLPTISTASLTTAGQVAGQTGFNIELSDCSAAIKTAAAFFESGGSVDPASGNLKNVSGSATKVQLQLVDATNGQAIKAGNTAQVTSTSRVDVANTSAILPYAVQYFAQAATTPGTVVSSVTYSINYQ
ncbi:putative fimbrial protein [Pseudomonas sp. FH4]|jgi:major type 1 subunit fimbrin (pilin)|uniref:Major type 1 subunit fimbrin (Pilin) n=1 Tax=Pseudomonas brenneri TaxID=129817 RepID=A0A5B2UX54_9PSED|nr:MULTISPECIES: fimbrial protein [Pseudomonas]KAA6175271.1 type 1 fimbrial protein [Pseudomonas marginalis]ETK20547.1 putative fimbrial protein [Pseudomonas sp. FH4]KAA2230447.1 type 1 fimbrial protein [Pseudomonas brenneri]MBF8006842.1 fimbrial protein [Pseudomonas brenneri]TWR77323.1 type 1 fimbrial protein [Pseudomonas brenneri]